MSVKSKNRKPVVATDIDPDDAPELTEEFFEKGTWSIGGKPVSAEAGRTAFLERLRRGRPKSANPKQLLTIRYDADVIAAFRAMGAGWQTRMNDALRDWLKHKQR